ncbi:MAG: signal peptide peptidase SppA [Treponema sp.]|jgi:protease-4|nr:signal peptide peptidase SppA [Treponema sp.]
MNVSRYMMLGVYCLVSFPLFSQTAYLELNLNKPVVQNKLRPVLPKPPLEVFRVIERAGKDRRINGIVLNIGSFYGNRDYLWELRGALEQFKSRGKKICAFISAADMDTYCLASVADKIVMDEQGALSMLGYVWGRGYMQHSLEKLGISVRELRYLEYKSAAESYTRDSMSEADRRQYGEYLDDIFNLTRSTLMNARGWTDEKFNEIVNRDFLYSAKSAKSENLVDYIGRKDAVVQAVKELEGAEVKHYALYGDGVSSLMNDHENYGPEKARSFFKRPPVIAIVYANGQTDMERGMAAMTLSRTIRELADKGRVKAVVLRINSPGGSAEAADYITEAVRYVKEKKPVVVSMGQVAASGGYWAAMNASHITATPYTLTGSIGVIGSWFFDNGMNTKLGFTVDSIQRGAHADLPTGFFIPRRDLSKDEEDRYRTYILDLYNEFTAKVAAGRNMQIEKVESVAQGRVFSGTAALNAGLIDSVGGIQDAIHTARALANIPDDASVLYGEYPKLNFFDKMVNRFSQMTAFIKSKNSASSAAAFLSELFLPEDIQYRLRRNGQVMPILPLGLILPETANNLYRQQNYF